MKKKLTAAALTVGLTCATAGAAFAAPKAKNPQPATPDIAALAGPLAQQQIDWGACDFGVPEYNELFPEAECATIQVPRDWHTPEDGATFDIAISRITTVDPSSPDYQGTITANPGGPGGEGLVWGPAMHMYLPELHGSYNFVGFDPRGVGQSTHGVCDLPADAVNAAATDEELYALVATCQDQPDVAAVNTEQTVYDMDFIRYLVDAPKLSYVGYSYGTWLGAWYGAVFGANADKFVLDSSTGLTDTTLERTFDIQANARDRQFEEHLMNWIARNDEVIGLGTVPSQVYADYLTASEALGDDFTALVWLLTQGYAAFPNNANYPTAAITVMLVIELGLPAEEAGAAAEVDEAAVIDRLQGRVAQLAQTAPELAEGVAEVQANLTDAAADAAAADAAAAQETVQFDDPFYWIMCQDGQFGQDIAAQQAKAERNGAENPVSRVLGTTAMGPCPFFTTDLAKPAPGADFPSTILLQSELDSQTAWELGYDSGTSLPNTTFIAVDNEGSHGLFPYGFDTVDQPVIDLFTTGVLPKKDIVAQGRPLPLDTTTWESWKRLNPQAKHVGRDEDNAWQPIKTNGNGHPALPSGGLTPAELLQQTAGGDAAVEAAQKLRELAEQLG